MMFRRYYTSVSKYERANQVQTVCNIEIMRTRAKMSEYSIRFLLCASKFEDLLEHIPFTFRFAAALLLAL